jgi:hypothetical protein
VRDRRAELDPTAPTTAVPTLELLSKKYGLSAAQARSTEEQQSND